MGIFSAEEVYEGWMRAIFSASTAVRARAEERIKWSDMVHQWRTRCIDLVHQSSGFESFHKEDCFFSDGRKKSTLNVSGIL